MATTVKGISQLQGRLAAIGETFKPYGKKWADTTADEMRHRVPVRTGRLRDSFKRKSATKKRAVVGGHYTSNFVDAGSKAHDIFPKNAPNLVFQAKGRTIFAKKVHKQRIAARPFKRAAALAAIRKHPLKQELIDQWNKAA